jgi:DNA-binding CsgD family transcriptional regulator
MSHSAASSSDILVLRDILDLADSERHTPTTAVVSEILRLLEGLLHSDGIAYHVMDSRDFSYQHAQDVLDGEEYVCPSEDLGVDPVPGGGVQVLWDHWWASPCSLIERTGAPVATSVRSWFSERRWAAHPVNVDYLRYADRLIFGYPVGVTGSLRILGTRESGPQFDERELTICRLLLPHLHDVLAAVVKPVGSPTRVLTARQREILRLAGAGMSNQQIGTALGISMTTVRTHLEHVFERLGVTSRTAAVTVAFGSGFQTAAVAEPEGAG